MISVKMKREIIDKTKFLGISKRLSAGEIVHAQLDNIKLDLNSETLIPHPMEIFFIDKVVEFIRVNKFLQIADIGTGSGILAIGIKMQRNLTLKRYYFDLTQIFLMK